MKELSKRTETFTDSVIRRMTRIANQYDAINLSQGFPDFDPPKQRCTRGYKRYKETSGLIEWKECQIFHSIFT